MREVRYPNFPAEARVLCLLFKYLPDIILTLACYQAKLIGGKLDAPKVDVIFMRASRAGRRISFAQFQDAIKQVCPSGMNAPAPILQEM